MKKARLRAFGLALAALLLAGAACGGGSGHESASARRTSTVARTSTPVATASSKATAGATRAAATPTPAVAAAAPTETAGATPTPVPVEVVLAEYLLVADTRSVPAGDVTFTLRNSGSVYHNMLIIKTDLAPDALPTEDDGSVDEYADSLDVVDSVPDLAPGEGDAITTTLDPGAYVLVCNIVDDQGAHYGHGMRAAFRVT
jgi:uncharacterized cupredoxin-like copper-binding protein